MKLNVQDELWRDILLKKKNEIKLDMEKMKQYSLSEMEDRYIGKPGTPERDEYEYELRMELLSRTIKSTRKERGLTQNVQLENRPMQLI